MAFFDLPLDQLENYQPEREEPADFEAFWEETIAEAREFNLEPCFEAIDFGLRTVEVFDVTFNGYGGQPIKGWLLLPANRSGKLPCVVEYIGYGGGRGYPTQWLDMSASGFAHLVMDTRGQGSAWMHGDTPDEEDQAGNPQYPGFMTRGILSPYTYYYRRLILDAVRAIETARSHNGIDPDQLIVKGGSQGGGLALIAAGLVPDLKAAMIDVPFLCHWKRATTITDCFPYQEIVLYLKNHRHQIERVFSTLSYFDGLNFAARAKSPALFSVGLMDDTCPPSTVYAAYNYYAGPKEIKVYEFNQHEGGGIHHDIERIKYLHRIFGG